MNEDLKKLPQTAIFPIQQKAIRGDPDFILCVNSHFVALELKAEDGSLDKLQLYKLQRVKKSGGVCIVAKPSTWLKAFALLHEIACLTTNPPPKMEH